MAQCNWLGLALTESDLTVEGTVLWDSATEGFSAPAGVRFTNVGSEVVYVHIDGFHVGDPDDANTWHYSVIPVGDTLDLIGRHPHRPSGSLKKAWGYSLTGSGSIVWTPTMNFNGDD